MEFIIMIIALVGIIFFVQWKLENDEKKTKPAEIDGGILKPKRKRKTVKRKAVKKVAKKKVVKKRSRKK